MKNSLSFKYQLKIYFKNGNTRYYFSSKRKRILSKAKAVKNSEVEKYYLKVSYGKVLSNNNQLIEAINDGEYFSIEKFMTAWDAFNEGI